MAWIEFHTALRDHYKISRLSEKLSISYAHSLGLMGCLWTWTTDNAKDGDLSKFTDAEVARAARWEGKVNGFVSYLKDCGLIDQDGKIHDWEDHGMRLLTQAKERKERWRNNPKKNKERSRERSKERYG